MKDKIKIDKYRQARYSVRDQKQEQEPCIHFEREDEEIPFSP